MNRRQLLKNTATLVAASLTLKMEGENAMADNGKIRALVVTGGHGFEREPFFAMFKGHEGITYQSVEHPNAHDWFKPEAAGQFDVIVLYDMWQDITDAAKAHFINLLKQGKGLVALHHALAGYQTWNEYATIIGGKFRLQKGSEKPSTFKHGVKFTVHVADSSHPVTKGLKDFEMVDETYGDFDVRPHVKPLLTTDEPTSGKTIGWAHTYGKSRVVYVQLGHDHTAYDNPNYRRLVAQAIRWVGASG
jgi:hypothetical protein